MGAIEICNKIDEYWQDYIYGKEKQATYFDIHSSDINESNIIIHASRLVTHGRRILEINNDILEVVNALIEPCELENINYTFVIKHPNLYSFQFKLGDSKVTFFQEENGPTDTKLPGPVWHIKFPDHLRMDPNPIF